VGATGISYAGMTAELLLVTNHPAVKAVAPRFTQFDEYTDVAFPGGVYFSALVDTWAGFTTALDRDVIPDSVPTWMRLGGTLIGAGVRPVDADHDRSQLAAAVRAHTDNFDHYAEIAQLTYRDDLTPSGLSIDGISPHPYAPRMQTSGAAVYSVSGWFDGSYVHAAIKRYLTLRNAGSRLTLGPWPHGGERNISPSSASPDTGFDHVADLLRFFDFHLKGIDTGIAGEPPVHYFTMGEDKWQAADTWPPPAVVRTYYCDAAHRLSTGRPAAEDADAYRVDLTATTGHQTRWDGITGGAPTAQAFAERSAADEKLLVYTSGPLDRDTEVTGHPIVTLWVSSTARDGQFFVYLEDADEQGHVRAITDGQLGAVHRKLSTAAPAYRDVVPYHSFTRADAMPLVPSEVAELVFDLLPTSYLFRPGHSLRVAVAGADVAHFAALSGDPPTVQVHRGGAHASHIDLPVISR